MKPYLYLILIVGMAVGFLTLVFRLTMDRPRIALIFALIYFAIATIVYLNASHERLSRTVMSVGAACLWCAYLPWENFAGQQYDPIDVPIRADLVILAGAFSLATLYIVFGSEACKSISRIGDKSSRPGEKKK